MITSLDHVQITIPVGAEPQGRAFYCGLLGLSEVAKPDALKDRGGFWLRIADRDVHVGTEDGVDREATKAHLAFEVSDLSFWCDTLRREGIEISDAIPLPGCRRFEFRDPFGNRLEMIERIA